MTWSAEKLLPEYVRCFEAYIPSKPDPELMKLYGCPFLYRLNNNENPLGPPETARKILAGYAPEKVAIYPSGDSYYLRLKLADKYGIEPDQILVGNGANEVIAFVVKAFCEQGDNIITADKTFAVYEWIAEFSGVRPQLVPLKENGFDDAGMIDRIDSRTKISFICNPNNPTGSYWTESRLRNYLESVKDSHVVVLDEAYAEFVEAGDYPNGIKLLNQYPNLIIFRTFSKMYGLAGLRIGYLIGALETVNAIRKTCIVYSVNSLAQEAAAAALDDPDHVCRTIDLVREGKSYLVHELDRLGLEYIVGEGNFLVIKLNMSDTLAYRKLMAQGIMVRSMTGFRFPNHIRISINQLYIMELFIKALENIL